MRIELESFERGEFNLEVKGLRGFEEKRCFLNDVKSRLKLMWEFMEYMEPCENGRGSYVVYKFNTKNNEVVIKYKDNEISIVGQNTKGLNDPYLASILDSIITIFDEFNMLYYVQGLPVVIEKKNYAMTISDKNKSEKFVIEF